MQHRDTLFTLNNIIRGVVLIMWGQSNQQGAAPIAELPADLAILNNCYLWNGISFVNLVAKTSSGYPQAGQDWGAELQIAYRLRQTLNKRVYIIKYAIGGTPLIPKPDVNNDWSVSTGELYTSAVTAINSALSYLDTNKVVYSILGMDWMQGETDALSAGVQAAYESELTILISQLRTDLAIPDLPVTINRIGTTRPGAAEVQAAQEAVAIADADAYLIASPTQGTTDGVHWNGASQIERGNSVLDFLLSL